MNEALLLAYRAEIEALISKREAMVAANNAHGGQFPPHSTFDFYELARQFSGIAEHIRSHQ